MPEVHGKKVRRWPTITAQAATARINSRESEAATESLRGIHATGIADGNSERTAVSVSIVRVAINSLQKSVRVVERRGSV